MRDLHRLWFYMGLTDANSWTYLLWSGIGAFLVAYCVYRLHNTCHHGWCPRIGKHPIDRTPYSACRRHHPDIPHHHRRGRLDLHAAAAHHRQHAVQRHG